MPLWRILQVALASSVVVYVVIGFATQGAPDWARPWVPEDQQQTLLLAVLLGMAAIDMAGGYLLGGLQKLPGFLGAPSEGSPRPGTNPRLTQFILALALIESGALFGLVYTFIRQDARYVLVAAVPAIALILLVPFHSPRQP